MMRRPPLVALVLAALLAGASAAAEPETTASEKLRETRGQFQRLKLVPGAGMGHTLSPGNPPRIVFADPEEARRLGTTAPLHVRWFGPALDEVTTLSGAGRHAAWVEGTAPNGLPYRRALTFFVRPQGFLWYSAPPVSFPPPNTALAPVWSEHRDELESAARDLLFRAFLESEEFATRAAGLHEAEPLGRKPAFREELSARNEAYHLALKLKVQGRTARVRAPAPPEPLDPPARVLRRGTAAEAGVRPGAKARIDSVCRAWARDSGEPFVALVARRGVIVTHEAFGRTPDGRAATRAYRADIASITKTITGILFARFVDQGLIGLDDPVSTVFDDWPAGDPRVPTFRQLLTHVSGFAGHGDFGGVRHPHLENIYLNALDTIEPGSRYVYSGVGYDLAGKAMEIVSGQPWRDVWHDHLLAPLGIPGIPMQNMSAGLSATAEELAVFAQWYLNRGAYGPRRYVREETFARMLPEDYAARYPGLTDEAPYGFGIGRKLLRRPLPADSATTASAETTATAGTEATTAPTAMADAAAADDSPTRGPGSLYFTPSMIGHGSLSQCIFLVDPELDLLIVQVRRKAGDRHGEWSAKFYEAIAGSLVTKP